MSLRRIAEKEKLNLQNDGLDAIFEVSGGDLRRAINALQAAASLGKPIDTNAVYSVIGRANPVDVRDMLDIAMKGDFIGSREKLRDMILKYGVSGSDLIRQIHIEVFRMKEVPEPWKIKLADIIGEVDFRLIQGADEEVQLSSLLARLVEAGYDMRRSR
jgi:replication factor C small subunit